MVLEQLFVITSQHLVRMWIGRWTTELEMQKKIRTKTWLTLVAWGSEELKLNT